MGMPISVNLAEQLCAEGAWQATVFERIGFQPTMGRDWTALLAWVHSLRGLAADADPFTDSFTRQHEMLQLNSMIKNGPEQFGQYDLTTKRHALAEMIAFAQSIALRAKAVEYENSQYRAQHAMAGERTTPDQVSSTDSEDPKAVFVVHGRDERVRKAIFAFLRALSLAPIEWSRAIQMTGKTAPFVGEILDAAFGRARAIIIVFSPDDEARLRDQFHDDGDPDWEAVLTPQPRPNVIFEAGMALGRAPDRTILVQIGKMRPFSDIAGRHVVKLRNDPQSRHEFAARLMTSGCAVDIAGQDWLTAGDFNVGQLGFRKARKELPNRKI